MLRNFKSFCILLSYFLITVATSYKDTTSQLTSTKSYSISSNCSNATFSSGVIGILGTEMISPNGVSFQNLGFPLNTLDLGQNTSGEIAPALIRNCVYSSSVIVGIAVSTYSCADNSIPACVIELTPQ